MSGRCEFATGCRLDRRYLAVNLHNELVAAQVASRGAWLCAEHAAAFARDGSALIGAAHPLAAELHAGRSCLVVASRPFADAIGQAARRME